jgi:Ras family protein
MFLIFSLTDKKSFDEIKKIYKKLTKFKNFNNFPIILIGNKHDDSEKRQVEFSDAKKLADLWETVYFETSSITNYNCKEAMQRLIDKIKNKVENENENKGKNCVII